MKKYRLWEIASAVIVMLLSPASVVFVLAIGISPEAWPMIYLRYLALFVTLPSLLLVQDLTSLPPTGCALRGRKPRS